MPTVRITDLSLLSHGRIEFAGLPTRAYLTSGWTVIGLFVLGLTIWSYQAPLASAVIASGELVVESSRKVVQHLEGGIVSKIYVRDGDRVKKGQPLIEIDPTAARTRLSLVRNRVDAALAIHGRLLAERHGRESPNFASSLLSRQSLPRTKELLQRETELFEARQNALHGQISLLSKRKEVLGQQIMGLEGQKLAKEQQIRIIEKENRGLKSLYEKGIVPVTRILALERAAAQLAGERSSHISEIAKARKEIGESDLRIVQLKKDFLNQVTNDLNEIEKNLADLRDQELAAEDVLNRTIISSPSDGVVVKIAVHTAGEVITPGATLLEIVPQSDALIVEGRIKPQDIDNVSTGQPVEIRLTAFNQRSTPTFAGELIHVSADRLETLRDKQPYYLIRAKIEDNFSVELKNFRVVPGMPAEIFINTGERTLLSYLTKPFADAFHRAMREE